MLFTGKIPGVNLCLVVSRDAKASTKTMTQITLTYMQLAIKMLYKS